MARLKNWRAQLSAAIEARRNVAMQWGVSDCGLTSADLAFAVCGVDYAARLRGYSTPEGAMRALRRAGFDNVTAFLDAHMPRTENPEPGDYVVVRDRPLDKTLIYGGPGFAWGQGPAGLERFALPANAKFWSV